MSSDKGALAFGRRRAPTVIEFIGAPGSGKTTLSNELISLLRQSGVSAGSIIDVARDHARRTILGRAVAWLAPPSLRRPLLWQVFYLLSIVHIVGFAREHLPLVLRVLRTQLQRKVPLATKRRALFWFAHLIGRYRFLQTTGVDGELIVVDDGFLHRSVHFYASYLEEPDPGSVARYVDLLPAPALVISVVVGDPVCERRIYQRGVWAHWSHLHPSHITSYVRNAQEVVQMTVTRARARGWTITEISNDARPLEDVRSDLRTVAARLLDTSFPDGTAAETPSTALSGPLRAGSG